MKSRSHFLVVQKEKKNGNFTKTTLYLLVHRTVYSRFVDPSLSRSTQETKIELEDIVSARTSTGHLKVAETSLLVDEPKFFREVHAVSKMGNPEPRLFCARKANTYSLLGDKFLTV